MKTITYNEQTHRLAPVEIIDRLNVQLKEAQAEIENVRKANIDCVDHFNALMEDLVASQARISELEIKLAASQANEVQLREALCEYKGVYGITGNMNLAADKALAIPSDTTALDAMIQKAGEVMRERCCYEQYKMEDRNACAVSFAIRALPNVTLHDLSHSS